MRVAKSQARVCQVANVCILVQIAFDFGIGSFAYLCMPQSSGLPQATLHFFMMNSRHIRSSSSSCAKCALNIYAHLSAFATHTRTHGRPLPRLLPQLVALATHKTIRLSYLQLLFLAKLNFASHYQFKCFDSFHWGFAVGRGMGHVFDQKSAALWSSSSLVAKLKLCG